MAGWYRNGMTAIGAATMLLTSHIAQAEGATTCTLSPPKKADLAAEADRFFPAASEAEIIALIACMADPDPAVRDEFAFTLWSNGLRGKMLSSERMRFAGRKLADILQDNDDAAGFRKPFAALALAEVARADRIAPFLTDAELHDLVDVAATTMRGVTDYRGFVAGEGWRHGVAHSADLMLQLALNPRLTCTDAGAMLAAIATQVAPTASPYYHHGEAARLARPLFYLAQRADISDADWAAWFATLHPDKAARWQAAYSSDEGLAAVHNSTAFAQAIYAATAEAKHENLRRLAPLATALLRALP